MTDRENAWLRHQQQRFMRPDAARFIRPDAARFLIPGTHPADVYPALALKYSEDQPRVPAGDPRGGQWTNGGGGVGANGGNSQPDVTQLIAQPMGNIDFGDISLDVGSDLFRITPSGSDGGGVLLAGDIPEGGIGDSPGTPSEEPPKIPEQMPKTSAQRTAFMRAAASWLARNPGPAGEVFTVAMSNVEWLIERQDLIQAARDPALTYEELQDGVGKRRPAYDDHHVVEQTLAERFGFTRSEIDDPSNLVSIPRLTHYQITGWYATENEEFSRMSPREYLNNKGWEERRRVGLYALRKFGVLKP